MEIDFKSKDFKFVSKLDEYFVEGTSVECEDDFTEWKDDKIISTGWGLFRGLTNVTYQGYNGELPRIDGDTSSFEEFNIYWKDQRVDHLTYGQLKSVVQSETRDVTLTGLIDRNGRFKPEHIEYPYQVGDIVKSKWNSYGKDDPCELDRLYKRKDGVLMARIIWNNKKVNVPQDTLEYHKSHFRNDKLDQLGL
jgi:hypothetical protein